MNESVERLVAFVPNWLGDAAMCTPALRALHQRFPQAEFVVCGRPAPCALLEGLPFISRIETVSQKSAADTFALGNALRKFRPDLAVVFPHSFRATLTAFLAGARTRLGYARGGRSWLLNRRVDPYRENGRITPIYMATEYLNLVEDLGCYNGTVGLELAAPEAEIAAVRERLGDGGPVVGFAPGAAFGPSKCWLPERYAAVADALADHVGARCVMLTGPGEEQTRAAVQNASKTEWIDPYGASPSIARLKAAVSQLDLLIGNDSGPRHVAVAFNVPTVIVMGSTSPRYSEGPYEQGDVLRVDVDCGPCQRPTCATDHRCMTRISVEQVVRAALRRLSGG